MKHRRVSIAVIALMCLLLVAPVGAHETECVVGIGVTNGAATNPSWLRVRVVPSQDSSLYVLVDAQARKGIAGYDLYMHVTSGDDSGLVIPVEVALDHGNHAAWVKAPASLFPRAHLTLCERLDEGADADVPKKRPREYVIILKTYLPKDEQPSVGEKADPSAEKQIPVAE